ncbi:MAG: hypothetical protein QOC58_711, partial [Mycobacterium sp.]|nr:hypothetical protein [Mycobacterium sp.]
MACDEALEALEGRDYERALSLLNRELAARSDGALHALAGLACFQLEDYGAAVKHYTAALHADGRRDDWGQMLAVAQANDTAGVNVHVPALDYFERDALLAPPAACEGALPAPLPGGPGHGHVKRLRLFSGEVLGAVATLVMDSITQLLGRVAGYRDRVWTNWYQRPLALRILTLAYMREQLNAKNLGSSYPDGTLVGFQRRGQEPPPGVTHFRTADGSWNNLDNPKEGAAGTR